MGMIHMLSAISVSILLSLLLLIAVGFLVRGTRLARNVTRPVVTSFPLQFDLLVGLAVYLGYHVVGGYQHMNFTFRYWIPGLIGAAVVAGVLTGAHTRAELERAPHTHIIASVADLPAILPA